MEFKPVSTRSRIAVVDALRGFALFGVLLANVPHAGQDGVIGEMDSQLTFLYHLLIDNKFITIFSILFGFGFGIQLHRAKSSQISFTRYFLVRMMLLFVIGMLHAYVIWNGDILRAYAVGGLALMFVRNWSIKRLLVAAVVFNVFATATIFIISSAGGWEGYIYEPALLMELPITMSYSRYMYINAITDPWSNFIKDMPLTLVFTFGNMLIGFILAKIDFFRLPKKYSGFLISFIVLGGTLGITASYVYYQIITGQLELAVSLIWVPYLVVIGMLLQSLAYISAFVKLFDMKVFRRALSFFTPVGKTALTNYIFQSVLFLFGFYHCVQLFALYGKLTLAETYFLAGGFFVLQSLGSYLWLKNEVQGPLEYVWKKLSYGILAKERDES